MNNTIKTIFKLTIAITVCVLFVFKAKESAEGVRQALNLCATVIIPPLFPFMTASSYMMKAGLFSAVEKRSEKLFRLIFSLPGSSGIIFLMSLVGGFPVGAKLIADSIKSGSLSKNQGKRMLLFCVNPGPAFVVNVVGCAMLGNYKAGVIIFVGLCISALITGMISAFFKNDKDCNQKHIRAKSSCPLVDSVSESAAAIIGVCAWVVFFSSLLSVINSMEINQSAKMWLCMFTEVTNGCAFSIKNFPLSITVFLLGWSGLSVHAQLMPYILTCGLKYKHFAVARLFNGALSMGISSVLFRIIPCEISVFSNAGEILPRAVSISVPATVGLLFLSALIILDLAPKRKV